MKDAFDLIIVGAGIVGLAHAYAGALRGLRVAVVDKDHRCTGASIRNFGFITVTGQSEGDTWRRAMHSRNVWAEVAPQAGIRIEHTGLWVLGTRPLAKVVLEAFQNTAMGQECRLHSPLQASQLAPMLRTQGASAALYSPHELRVESRQAIPLLTQWLQETHNVQFYFGEAVMSVDAPKVHTARRILQADRVIICPGTELTGIGLQALSAHALRLTRLQMLRVRPHNDLRMTAGVMGDLSLVRYGGYAALAESAALRHQLEMQENASLVNGIHLIVVQSADGSLVVGDSHHDADSPLPFASEDVDQLILRHLKETLQIDGLDILERWTGVYPTGAATDCVIEAPNHATRVVVVTSGTGASTAFGIAEDTFKDW